MSKVVISIAGITLLFLTAVAASAFSQLTAMVQVSSGTLYDYVVVGEHPNALDTFDNAYDTISPGNLNADMGEAFITAVIVHPEWKGPMKELRGDIRSTTTKQDWSLTVSSSIPKGTPLTVALQPDRTTLPKGATLTVRTSSKGKAINLVKESYTLPAPGPGLKAQVTITAEQP